MDDKLKKAWDEAFANPGRSVPVGNSVACDACGEDLTHSRVQGGILVQSKAICPACQPLWEADMRRFKETHLIRARCPEGQAFADWVRALRGPGAAVKVT